MPRTPEEVAATEALEQAIQKFMALLDIRSDAQLGDWLVIASAPYVDPDGDVDSEYFALLSGGSMLNHVVQGLLAKGRDIFKGQVRDEEED